MLQSEMAPNNGAGLNVAWLQPDKVHGSSDPASVSKVSVHCYARLFAACVQCMRVNIYKKLIFLPPLLVCEGSSYHHHLREHCRWAW